MLNKYKYYPFIIVWMFSVLNAALYPDKAHTSKEEWMNAILSLRAPLCREELLGRVLKGFFKEHLLFNNVNDEVASRATAAYVREISDNKTCLTMGEAGPYLFPDLNIIRQGKSAFSLKDIALLKGIHELYMHGAERKLKIIDSMQSNLEQLFEAYTCNIKAVHLQGRSGMVFPDNEFAFNIEGLHCNIERDLFKFCYLYEKESKEHLSSIKDFERICKFYRLVCDYKAKELSGVLHAALEDVICNKAVSTTMSVCDDFSGMWSKLGGSSCALEKKQGLSMQERMPVVSVRHTGEHFVISFPNFLKIAEGTKTVLDVGQEAKLYSVNGIRILPGMGLDKITNILKGREGSLVHISFTFDDSYIYVVSLERCAESLHDGLILKRAPSQQPATQQLQSVCQNTEPLPLQGLSMQGNTLSSIIKEGCKCSFSVINVKGGHRVLVVKLPAFYAKEDKEQLLCNSLKESVQTAADDLENIIKSVQSSSETRVDGMVLDIRDNPGGLVVSAMKAASLFLDSSLLKDVCFITRNEKICNELKYKKEPIIKHSLGKKIFKGPVVVLVNSRTVSAAELFAFIMKYYGRGVLVGSKKTAGKGVAQNPVHTEDADPFALHNLYRYNHYNDLFPFCFYKVTSTMVELKGFTFQLQGVQSDITLPYRSCRPLRYPFKFPVNPSKVCIDGASTIKTDIISAGKEVLHVEGLTERHEKRKLNKLDAKVSYCIVSKEVGSLEHMDESLSESINILYDLIVFGRDTKKVESQSRKMRLPSFLKKKKAYI